MRSTVRLRVGVGVVAWVMRMGSRCSEGSIWGVGHTRGAVRVYTASSMGIVGWCIQVGMWVHIEPPSLVLEPGLGLGLEHFLER